MPAPPFRLRRNLVDATYKLGKLYGMQRKLTLRMDDAVIRKAKRLARQRGQSVSRMLSEYVSEAAEESGPSLPPMTAAMVGVLGKSGPLPETDYRKHLEEKHL